MNSREGKHLEFRGTVGLDDRRKTMQMFQIRRLLMMTRKGPQQPTGWFFSAVLLPFLWCLAPQGCVFGICYKRIRVFTVLDISEK